MQSIAYTVNPRDTTSSQYNVIYYVFLFPGYGIFPALQCGPKILKSNLAADSTPSHKKYKRKNTKKSNLNCLISIN